MKEVNSYNGIAIESFTHPKTGEKFPVNVLGIFAVEPLATGTQGAYLIGTTGYKLEVKEGLGQATEMWLGAVSKLSGNA